MPLNEDLFRALNGAGHPILDPVAVALGFVGLLYFALLWCVPLWFLKRRRDAVDLALLLILDAVLVAVLKAATRVPRPDGILLSVPFDDVSDFSFPSGHTTRAFAAALLLTLRSKDRRWGIPLFAYATAMGLSRIYVGAHWPSDVLAGALLGTAWAYGFERLTRHPAYAARRDRFVRWLEAFRKPRG